ncbi:MAG: amino acid ABC transporter permease [Oscillospiraceae bacterium]
MNFATSFARAGLLLSQAAEVTEEQAGFWAKLYEAAIGDGNWKLYLGGIVNTLIITVLALVLGVLIGVFIALVKTQYRTTGRLKILNAICSLYTTVIRGTPVVVQLLIIYFMLFATAPAESKVLIAALSFGINSGAYVSEIIRAGIQSIDPGQTEAGRSLGLTHGQTMRLIVLPQAVRNILPALFNEMISLLKETSVAGFIGLTDITYAGDMVRSRTWTFHPFLVSAMIYLVIVISLTQVQKVMERRLATR